MHLVWISNLDILHYEEWTMALSVFNPSFCCSSPFHLVLVAVSRLCHLSEFYPNRALLIELLSGYMQFASSLLSLQFVLSVRLCNHFVVSWIFFRPEVLMVAFVLSIGLLLGLMFKRKEHPTNMYLLLAFVSYLSVLQVECSLAIVWTTVALEGGFPPIEAFF